MIEAQRRLGALALRGASSLQETEQALGWLHQGAHAWLYRASWIAEAHRAPNRTCSAVEIDGLRPHTQRLWTALPDAERRRFLRHLRPYWEVHRHRLAPPVAARLQAALAGGRLRVLAARLQGIELTAVDRLRVQGRLRSGGAMLTLDTDVLINCTSIGLNDPSGRVPVDFAAAALISAIATRRAPISVPKISGADWNAMAWAWPMNPVPTMPMPIVRDISMIL